METTLSLRLERAQLAAERLEHRIHMLQTSVEVSYVMVPTLVTTINWACVC